MRLAYGAGVRQWGAHQSCSRRVAAAALAQAPLQPRRALAVLLQADLPLLAARAALDVLSRRECPEAAEAFAEACEVRHLSFLFFLFSLSCAAVSGGVHGAAGE